MKQALKKFIPKSLRPELPRWIRTFKMFEKMGYHVHPIHYYSPMPDLRELSKNKHEWNVETDFSKIDYDLEYQLHLNDIFSTYKEECALLPSFKDLITKGFGPGYGEIEAHIQHCVIRHFKPRKIIEVGCGISTFYSSNALLMNKNEGHESGLTCIEPYPFKNLKDIPFIDKIIPEKVQNVSADFFQQLEENDILFIDSSHTVKIGSDVNYLFLDILPYLKKGVLIHIHDIPFPYLYPYPESAIFDRLRFWQEPVLLKAFLINNHAFKMIYCSSHLHFKQPELLESAFPAYDKKKHFPASLWIQKVA